MFDRETPAGYARLLYTQAKAARDDLKRRGYDMDEAYFVMVSAVVRLAMEEGKSERLREVARMLLEELSHSEEMAEGLKSEPLEALMATMRGLDKQR